MYFLANILHANIVILLAMIPTVESIGVFFKILSFVNSKTLNYFKRKRDKIKPRHTKLLTKRKQAKKDECEQVIKRLEPFAIFLDWANLVSDCMAVELFTVSSSNLKLIGFIRGKLLGKFKECVFSQKTFKKKSVHYH